LSFRQSELGQREAALASIQEAVTIRRDLATQRPDAFLPNLAGSLNNLGDRLKWLDEAQAAYEAYYEAVQRLQQHFLAIPQAFARQMSYTVKDYLDQCQTLGKEVDTELVAPIEEVLQQFQE